MEFPRALPLLLLAALLMPVPPSTASDALSDRLAGAASAFLVTLAPGERAKVQLAFDSDERFNWFYIPKDREGLPLKQMSAVQQKAALHLIETGLSQKGYSKAEAIRALDLILAEIEKNPVRRDPEKYYLTLFGDPSPTGTWGMRWEGHHVSLHWTLVNGVAIATTPQFFGSNPAEVRDGPKSGTRVLHAEEDLARALVTALSTEQKAVALLSPTAPDDILTTNTRKAAIQENTGLAYKDMTQAQRGMLLALIEEYASTQPKPQAAERVAKLRTAGLDLVKFAWMGGMEKGALHYYRVQGPTFLIEYDCVQNGGNHVHAVWRGFDGDFGVDLLEQHYKKSAHHHGQK
ncbi:MAG: DUF3500 domain-containing protein [Vicinamibacteria bacterium]|nr:DUF3500 domain-containing protein [Vicinamibacteria bacterium]